VLVAVCASGKYEVTQVSSNPHLYFVILAGGNGERLWPLSRRAMPKQLLKITTDTTLLEQAIDRIRPLAYSADNIWISTTQQHEPLIADLLAGRIGRIVIEPGARNTAPAILQCCHLLYEHDPNARVIFLPADAFIVERDYGAFQAGIQKCIAWIQQSDSLVLCGVRPRYPATGYGYIEYVPNDESSVLRVTRFHEKPTHAVASYYLQMSTMLWNIGIVGGRATAFIAEFQEHAPDLHKALAEYRAGVQSYAHVPSISVDYAILERLQEVYVVPLDISWYDVGNIGVLLALQQQEVVPAVMAVNAQNNLVYAHDKLVVFIGVEKLCVVDTADVLLITHADAAESVKVVVDQLKQQGSQYL